MPRVDFDRLPDHGRVWVFPASRPLSDAETAGLHAAVAEFLDGWAAHGVPLRSAAELVEGRFLVVGVDVDAEAPSGCSIDALVGRLRDFGAGHGVRLIDHAPVWYRDADGAIRAVSRAEFRGLVEAGAVDGTTRVFDTSLTRVGQVREGLLELDARDAWHGRAFLGTGATA